MPAFVRKMHSIRSRLGFCPVPAERSQVKHSMNVRKLKEAKFSTGRKRRHGGRFEADPTKLAQIHQYDGLNPTLTPIFFTPAISTHQRISYSYHILYDDWIGKEFYGSHLQPKGAGP